MSRQFYNHVNSYDYKNLSVLNKKKLQMKDKITKFTISLDPFNCQICGKPPGKLLWCKHIIFYMKDVYNYSIAEMNLYNDTLNDKECCICLEVIHYPEEQCLRCSQFYHKRCVKKLFTCSVCQYTLR